MLYWLHVCTCLRLLVWNAGRSHVKKIPSAKKVGGGGGGGKRPPPPLPLPVRRLWLALLTEPTRSSIVFNSRCSAIQHPLKQSVDITTIVFNLPSTRPQNLERLSYYTALNNVSAVSLSVFKTVFRRVARIFRGGRGGAY